MADVIQTSGSFLSLQVILSVIAAIVLLYFLMQWFGPKPATTTPAATVATT